MPDPALRLHSLGQTTGDVASLPGDWVVIVVNDPNGPALGILGQVDGWDDNGVNIATPDDPTAPILIPYSTIEFVHAIDGPVTGPIEFDPQRP